MIFITIIVKFPVVQIISMLIGLFMVALDYPMPFLKNTAIHRSLIVRVVGLILQAFFAVIFYQVRVAVLFSTTVLSNHSDIARALMVHYGL